MHTLNMVVCVAPCSCMFSQVMEGMDQFYMNAVLEADHHRVSSHLCVTLTTHSVGMHNTQCECNVLLHTYIVENLFFLRHKINFAMNEL